MLDAIFQQINSWESDPLTSSLLNPEGVEYTYAGKTNLKSNDTCRFYFLKTHQEYVDDLRWVVNTTQSVRFSKCQYTNSNNNQNNININQNNNQRLQLQQLIIGNHEPCSNQQERLAGTPSDACQSGFSIRHGC